MAGSEVGGLMAFKRCDFTASTFDEIRYHSALCSYITPADVYLILYSLLGDDVNDCDAPNRNLRLGDCPLLTV
jgi:hypothetical protein